ncbi:minor capsid protein [Bacillus sp. JJ1562]|uniref:minor capsid protein n=1 Tax=Bacillus sp. JJ1562 TaxID=3122960 RepID=UPI003002887C
MVKVKVKVDLKGVNKRTQQMTKSGQYALANQVHADSNIYAPMKSTDLRNQSTIAIDGKSIIWHARYARRQYYNQFSNYTTPGTGPKWDKKALSIHRSQWERITKKAMK